MHLAEFNLARLAAPLDDARMADFVAAVPVINAIADESPGFVWRLVDEEGADAMGLRDFGDDVIVNLTVWESVETLRAYAYKTAHLDYLRRRRDWFLPFGDLNEVAWWIPVDHRPSLAEASTRLSQLRASGSTDEAFSLRHARPLGQSVGGGR
jgi:hypothetical protein